MEMMTTLDLVRSGMGGLLVALGLVFMVGGAIGVLRFPDFYTRLHAVRVADGVGGVVLVVGLAFVSADWETALRLLLLAVLVGALGPTLSHLSANAAHAAGLAPLAGRYAAPRPGANRGDAQ